MSRTIIGSFADLAVAGCVVDDLLRAGLSRDAVSVVMTRNAWFRYRRGTRLPKPSAGVRRALNAPPWRRMVNSDADGIPGGVVAGGPLANLLQQASAPTLATALEALDVEPSEAWRAEAHLKEDAIVVAVSSSDAAMVDRARGVIEMHSAAMTLERGPLGGSGPRATK